MRILFSILSLMLFAGALFFINAYYQSQSALFEQNPEYAVAQLQELLAMIWVFGMLAVSIFVVLINVLISLRSLARRLAYTYTKDIAFSRDRLRRFYELSPVPYLQVDRQGIITRPNKAALRFFGTGEEGLIGKQMFDFFTVPEDLEKLERCHEQIRRSIPIEQRELQVRTASGEVRWALFSAENLNEQQSKDDQVLVTLVDIHEQKELERVKTEFLSLASHQLRAPLANLKWYIDFLMKRRATDLTEEVAEYLQKMYQRNEEMIDLVNTLLNLSRVEMGRLKVQPEDTDIVALVTSVTEELTPAAVEKDIDLTVDMPDEAVFETDGKLLRIVLQNLMTNAFRYTPASGAVSIEVVLRTRSLEIHVSDTGAGIPPEEQGRIFSKMYRATNAQAIEANGNGIGLYMCKGLVEAMNGTIDFTSTLNEGTTFSVILLS